MVQLQEILPQIEELGYQLLAASADKPDVSQQNASGLGVTFPLLHDSDLAAAQAFGIVWDTVDRGAEMHQRLEKASGQSHHLLAVPAVFVIDSEGVIQFEYVNPNHQVRIDSDVLLDALRAHQRRLQNAHD